MQATDGNFYGTTGNGGANQAPCNGYGCGTVFKITPNGALTTLYSFCSQQNCVDGGSPFAALVQATDGNFYGTADSGGANSGGTVFRLSPVVTFTPASLNFGSQGINLPNTPLTAILTNTGAAPLLISNIAITGTNGGDFPVLNNTCPTAPGTLTPGGSCSITIVFAPTGSGMRNAAVTVTDNAPDSPEMLPLSGIGVGGKARPK